MHHTSHGRILFGLILLLALPCRSISNAGDTGRAGNPMAPIGLDKQLLVDDFTIATQHNVRRVLGPVTKANHGEPILLADKPWEDDAFGFYGTVLHDGGKFRMWYRPWSCAVAYAESDDGIHWRKPNLGLYDFSIAKANGESGVDGTFNARDGMATDWHGKQNNILGVFGDGFTCFVDSHETDPAHRYKACYGHPKKIAACLAHSPDGIHWTPYNNGEPVTGRAADTYNQLLWDDAAKTYRLLTRTDFGRNEVEIRGSRVMLNPDVKANPTAWTTVRTWQFDREGTEEFKRRQIYGITDWIYEGIHFGLLMGYEWPHDASGAAAMKPADIDYHKRHDHDVMEVYLAPCRDGMNWNLDWVYAGKPLVPRGPDDSFDKDMIIASSNIVTYQNKHWIYYAGFRERHGLVPRKPEIGLATLPLDRFVGLEPTDDLGTAITHPFRLDGGNLILNVDARQGSIAVEVLDRNGQPFAGFAAKDCRTMDSADDLCLPVHWRGADGLAELKGQVVQLRFVLSRATLYAFQVQP